MIAALELEIAPLARCFRRREDHRGGYTVWERDEAVLVCGGIGARHAADVTRWVIASRNPEGVMSVGFAGALEPNRKVGDVIIPAQVIDGSTGEVFAVQSGQGVLVSSTEVKTAIGKRELATRYHAQAVDMEAAAVARVTRELCVPFRAVKVVSDELDFAMPPMDQFVDDHGQFRASKLLAYAAVRPRLWPVLLQLSRNSRLASSQLCSWLGNHISRDFQQVTQPVMARP